MKSLSGRTTNIMISLVILIVFILILRQAEIVRAQNESNITGYMISNITSNISENFTLRNETVSFNLTENLSSNETNTSDNTSLGINETLENITINETLTTNETSNETSQQNFTSNETLEQNETEEILNETNETSIEPEIPQESIFDINLIYSEKITRGETITVRASVINFGSSTRNVVLIWKVPDDFKIISENDREFCGNLNTNDVCMSEIRLKTDVSTVLGLNEIKVVVSYEV